MNPKTGEVLAMASRPSYNPNKFWDYNAEVWKNRAVSFIYEPGSTFKSVVAGAALQEKVVSPNQVFVDPGYVMVSGRRIQNWNGESFGTVTFTDVVKQSLNTGFAQVGLRLGAERLMSYARNFGFAICACGHDVAQVRDISGAGVYYQRLGGTGCMHDERVCPRDGHKRDVVRAYAENRGRHIPAFPYCFSYLYIRPHSNPSMEMSGNRRQFRYDALLTFANSWESGDRILRN